MAMTVLPRRLNGRHAPNDSSAIARQREQDSALRKHRLSEELKASEMLEQISISGDALDQKLRALRKQLGVGG